MSGPGEACPVEASVERRCPRPIKIVRLLLLLQALGLGVVGAFGWAIDRLAPDLPATWRGWAAPSISLRESLTSLRESSISLRESWLAGLVRVLDDLYGVAREMPYLSLALFLVAVTCLSAALGLCRLRRRTWLLAVAAQGLQLLIAVILYYTVAPAYVSWFMVYGVFMVIYLNYSEVTDAFRPALP